MSQLEIVLISTLGTTFLAIIGFIGKEIFWKNAQKNQDRIDNGIIDSVKKHEDKITEIEKKIQGNDFKIHALQEDTEELKMAWRDSNKEKAELNRTLIMLDNNMKLQHQESRQQAEKTNSLIEKNNALFSTLSDFLISLKK